MLSRRQRRGRRLVDEGRAVGTLTKSFPALAPRAMNWSSQGLQPELAGVIERCGPVVSGHGSARRPQGGANDRVSNPPPFVSQCGEVGLARRQAPPRSFGVPVEEHEIRQLGDVVDSVRDPQARLHEVDCVADRARRLVEPALGLIDVATSAGATMPSSSSPPRILLTSSTAPPRLPPERRRLVALPLPVRQALGHLRFLLAVRGIFEVSELLEQRFQLTFLTRLVRPSGSPPASGRRRRRRRGSAIRSDMESASDRACSTHSIPVGKVGPEVVSDRRKDSTAVAGGRPAKEDAKAPARVSR